MGKKANPEPATELDPIPFAELYPEELDLDERRWRLTRRIGIALSGGGIRSATLSLGFFQGLAAVPPPAGARDEQNAARDPSAMDDTGLLRHVDYLSTVSGGGYFGGFFSHLIRRPGAVDVDPVEAGERLPDAVLRDQRSRAIDYLRRNGRYLTPNGSGDSVLAGAIALRNWISVIVLVSLLALALLSLLTAARVQLSDAPVIGPFTGGIELFEGRLRVSPWAWLSLISLLGFAVPAGWAYWLVTDNPQAPTRSQLVARFLAPVALVAAGVILWRGDLPPAFSSGAFARTVAAGSVVSVTAFGMWLVFRLHLGNERVDRQRYVHSRILARSLVAAVALAAVALVDTIGQTLAASWHIFAGGSAAIAALIGGARGRLLAVASGLRGATAPRLPLSVLAGVGAALILLILLGGLATIPYVVLTGFAPADPSRWLHPSVGPLWVLASSVTVLALAAGWLRPFVNRSSLHAFYEARLRRTYLGASNVERLKKQDHPPPDSEPQPRDGLGWSEFRTPVPHGGPIHLVNVTINETIDGRTQLQQRDRKGLPMAIGPAGVSVSRTHHATWHPRSTPEPATAAVPADPLTRPPRRPASGFRVFPSRSKPEILDPGQWIAISGGAVSTGLGARTSVGLSLLLGLFNVRLGYWWRSRGETRPQDTATRRTWVQRIMAQLRRVVPVHSSLLSEWFARFEGTARTEWNLSDGGHFENLGAYELLRRRLNLIIVCDHEQDEGYAFGGLAELVRKARVDLDARITFLDARQLRIARGEAQKDDEPATAADPRPPFVPKRGLIGTLDDLRRGYRRTESLPTGRTADPRTINDGDARATSLAHAALARIEYGTCSGEAPNAERSFGWMLYVKSTLTGDESADVLQYHTAHPDFPHQSTADQFFDEAQWESYRALGEHVAQELFVKDAALADWVRRGARP